MITSTTPQPKVPKANETEDRISILPDVILAHILSFLPTKESVRTAILSNRWKSIWVSVTTLNITKEDLDLDDENTCRNFVNSALGGRKIPCLENVSISCQNIYPSIVKSWISASFKRNIRSLDISVCLKDPPQLLPQNLFTCYTLAELKLEMRAVLHFPVSSTSFPNLKVLKLSFIRFIDDESAKKFISSCPVLEDLKMTIDENKSFRTLHISSSSLKRFSLCFIQGLMFKHVRKIVIDAPFLEFIHITDNVINMYELETDFPCLVKAKLDFWTLVVSRFPAKHCLFELLNKISHVKSLSISASTIKTLLAIDGKRLHLPIFPNLIRMEFYEYAGKMLDWKSIMEFLKSSPVLETLIFEGFVFSPEKSRNWINDVPSCLASHLKTIKISGSILENRETEKVAYFIENASVLEKMIVETAAGVKSLILPRDSQTFDVET